MAGPLFARCTQSSAQVLVFRSVRHCLLFGGEEALKRACASRPHCAWCSQEFCLHALVASRHDRGLLFEALHGLSSGLAAALLRYLHTWLGHHTQLAAGPLGLSGASGNASGLCPCHIAECAPTLPRQFVQRYVRFRLLGLNMTFGGFQRLYKAFCHDRVPASQLAHRRPAIDSSNGFERITCRL